MSEFIVKLIVVCRYIYNIYLNLQIGINLDGKNTNIYNFLQILLGCRKNVSLFNLQQSKTCGCWDYIKNKPPNTGQK